MMLDVIFVSPNVHLMGIFGQFYKLLNKVQFLITNQNLKKILKKFKLFKNSKLSERLPSPLHINN